MADIPILGKLFTSTAYSRGETELIILITPTIVDPAEYLPRITLEMKEFLKEDPVGGTKNGEKIKILIVDDIADIRENICKLLEFHPEVAVVGQAATAVEGIEKAKLTEPDVVLMDINMPGMDGIAATEIITADVPGINIIMMSVQGEQEYLRRAMIAGAKNYLIKPFTSDELLQAVKQVYSNEQKRKNTLKGAVKAI